MWFAVPAVRSDDDALVRSHPWLTLILGVGTLAAMAGFGVLCTLRAEPPMPVAVQPAPPRAVAPPPAIAPEPPPPRVPPEVQRPPAPEPPAPEPVLEAEPSPTPSMLDESNSALLEMVTTPSDAKAWVDGKGPCITPCSVRVTFGRHEVRLEHEGKVVERRVNVLEDTTLDVSMAQ